MEGAHVLVATFIATLIEVNNEQIIVKLQRHVKNDRLEEKVRWIEAESLQGSHFLLLKAMVHISTSHRGVFRHPRVGSLTPSI